MAVTGNECKDFIAAEGQYVLKREIYLEPTTPNLTGGTLISLVSVKYKEYTSHRQSSSGDGASTEPTGDNTLSNRPPSTDDSPLDNSTEDAADSVRSQPQPQNSQEPPSPTTTTYKEPVSPGDASAIKSPTQNSFTPKQSLGGNVPIPTAIEGKRDDEGAFTSLFSAAKRKKQPKHSITKTNSSFVTKIITNENFAKILANRQNEDTYLFYNIGRTFCWTDLTNNSKEPLSRVNFKAFPTCHDVNQLTRSCDHLDVIVGFSSGDVIWFDPLCNKYYRLNKAGIINGSTVTMVKWIPGSENLFMASYQDGSVIIYDKEKDDQNFTSNGVNDDEGFRVTRPSKHSKHNPVSHWHVSKKAVTAFAFSPDCQHVAIVSVDGCLRIVDFLQERLYDTYSSYFGGFSCVCWSPDGKYILTGGQDDLVTIWAFREQRILARCQGHASWVTGVAFDPWRCDEQNYRFGSVGEDTKLLLWDFSVNALHKPKTLSHRRASVASQSHGSTTTLRRNVAEPEPNVVHPYLPRSEVAVLPPVVAKSVDPDPLSSITFREDAIIVTCRKGHIKLFSRPSQ